MALNESEVRVLALLGFIICILWIFFGLFWSLLLVFTFLIYAYKFGRTETASTQHLRNWQSSEKIKEKVYGDARLDVPFTAGLPRATTAKENPVSLRSPMPLLSEVTRRLSYNMSKTTPFPTTNTGRFHVVMPRKTPYHSKPNRFSLLSPVLHQQQQPTVKIASPNISADGTFTMCESPMKRAVKVVSDSCSKEAVIAALKKSRKRSIIDDNEMEQTFRPAKRRSEVVKTQPESLRTGFGVKRPVLQEDTCTFEGDNKESATKPGSSNYPPLPKRSKTDDKQNVASHKRKSQLVDNPHHSNSEEDLGVKSKKAKAVTQTEQLTQRSSPVKKAIDVLHNPAVDRKDCQKILGEESTAKENRQSYVTKVQQADTTVSSQTHEERHEKQQVAESNSAKEKKRFLVPRFPSKDDSRRRTVPVYCASTAESDMPQQRAGSWKITREQIQVDRQLAWERVRRLLDDVDEGDEDAKTGNKQDNQSVTQKTLKDSKPVTSTTCQTTGSVPVTSVTSSSFKIPAVELAATSSRGLSTSAMASTQSLSTPLDTTSQPGRSEVSDARPVAQGVPLVGIAVTRPQDSAVSTVKTQNALSSGLVPNFSTGLSTTVSPALSNVPISSGVQAKLLKCSVEATSSSSTTLTFSLVTPVSTSTVKTSQCAPGTQLPSSMLFLGNSLSNSSQSTLPAISAAKSTTSVVSDTAQQSFGFATPSTGITAQKGRFAFAAVTSSGGLGASSPATSTTQQHSGTPSQSTSSGPSLAALGSAPSQRSFGFGNTSIQSGFGNSSTLKHGGFQSTNQNKLTFGTTNIQGTFGSSQQLQNNFNQPSGTTTGLQQNRTAFGAPSSESVCRTNPNKTATQNTFGDPPTNNAFGVNVSQNTAQAPFGSVATQNAFTIQPKQTATPSGFGTQQGQNPLGSQLKKSSTQNSFGIQPAQSPFGLQPNVTTTQSPFGAVATQNAFGIQTKQPAVAQSTFGGQSVQSVFGGQPSQTFPQSTFGSQSSQNRFGTQPNQNAFGGSQFSFNGSQNSAQTTTNSPFAGFGNTASSSQASSTVTAKQNTFGPGSSQNTTNSSGGFNFSSSANNAKSAGFNFGVVTNQTAQFQCGPSSTTTFGNFGQTPAQPSAVPATPAPSGGFNFAPGSSGVSGSPFAASSTPQGNSVAAARTRARIAARRRGRK